MRERERERKKKGKKSFQIIDICEHQKSKTDMNFQIRVI